VNVMDCTSAHVTIDSSDSTTGIMCALMNKFI
jgi:hypothetical protein